MQDRTRLLSDNGSGYVSRAFRDYLHLVGIRHILQHPSTLRPTASWSAITKLSIRTLTRSPTGCRPTSRRQSPLLWATTTTGSITWPWATSRLLTCSTGGGSRSYNAGRRCRSRRSHGEDAITGPSRSSPDTPHNNNLLGSQSVPLLLIDNNQESPAAHLGDEQSTVVQDRQPAGRRQPLQCAIGGRRRLRSTRPAGPRRPKRRRGLGTAGDAVSYAPCKEPTPPYKHRAGSVWRRQLRCSRNRQLPQPWRPRLR